jgi:hypothetical protein
MYFPSPSLTLNISNSLSTYIVSEFLSSEFQLSMCVFSILKACMLACLLAIASYSICYAMHAALLILRIANTTWVSTTLTALLYPSQSTTQRMRKLVQTSLTYSKHTNTYEEVSEWMRMNEWDTWVIHVRVWDCFLACFHPSMHTHSQQHSNVWERKKERMKWMCRQVRLLQPHAELTFSSSPASPMISSSFTRELQLPPS